MRVLALHKLTLALALTALGLACGGGGSSTTSPIVTSPPGTVPTVASFSPSLGYAGQSVVITGTRFTGTTAVFFHGVAAASYHVDSASQITTTVPDGATTGTLAVVTPNGTATSTASFTVTAEPAPTLSNFTPASGPEGTVVTLSGTNFINVTAVTFNGTNAATFTADSATQIKATVPSGATNGIIAVTTGGGTVQSANAFDVTGIATLDLVLEGWHINQGSQDYAGTVPLVANRDGILRAFVTANGPNSATPQVQVTISKGGSIVWQDTIDAPGASVPTAVDEGDMSKSWNILVPGSTLSSGATITVEVDPTGAFPESNKNNNNETDVSLTVETVNPFKITIVPIQSGTLTGNVDGGGRTLESWMDRFKRIYPVQNAAGGIDVQKSPDVLVTSANFSSATGAGTSSDWNTCLSELEVKRDAEASDRYYFGAVNVNYGSGIAGMGYVPYSSAGAPTSAIGWDKTGYKDGGNYPEVLAHEVGHNLGRDHAPCGVSGSTDPSWPTAYTNASIGVYGMDVENKDLKAPDTFKDIMSYCSPVWTSDHTYKAVLDFRKGNANALVIDAAPTKQECLVIAGFIENGQVTLDSVFQVLTVPQLPKAGNHTLELQDSAGRALVQVPFEPVEVADYPGGDLQHFVFTIPLEASVESALAGIRVLEKGEMKVSRRSLSNALVAGAREPVATFMKPGEAHISWDSAVHRKVMVRDPRTGEVIAFGREGSLDLPTNAGELEMTFSDGVRSQRRLMKVQE